MEVSPAIVSFVLLIASLSFAIWSCAAILFDVRTPFLRVPLALLFAAGTLAVLWRLRGIYKKAAALTALCLIVLAWWLTLRPTNNQNWQPDVAELAYADVQGDTVTVHNVRNCSYVTELNYTPHWETRSYRLSALRGVDLFLIRWGAPLIAHVIVSFDFGADNHLAMSIEARKTVGQDYSALRGFFRQFNLIYIAADERDVVRVRTNYRKGENVFLYHTLTTPADARALLLQYVRWMNDNHRTPHWYNALTENCSVSVTRYLAAQKVGGLSDWDWRTVLNGSGDKMLYQLGDLTTGGLSFEQLRSQAWINPKAKAIGDTPDFSAQIRRGHPGF